MSGPTTRNRSKVKDSDKMNEVKLDKILNKMDEILKWKEQQEKKLDNILEKLQCLEVTQKGIRADVEELKESHNSFDAELRKVNLELQDKAGKDEVRELQDKIDDLENRSKRNNFVIWSLREQSEGKHIEKILEEEFFKKHMELNDIEVMRAHRTNTLPQRSRFHTGRSPLNANSKPRPIHVYLLRYTDKIRVLRSAAKKLKGNKFKDCQIYISDDVSKKVRSRRAQLRRDHLPHYKEKENVEFAFIPWSVSLKFFTRYLAKRS